MIDGNRIEKWQDDLTEYQLDLVLSESAALLGRLGYKNEKI